MRAPLNLPGLLRRWLAACPKVSAIVLVGEGPKPSGPCANHVDFVLLNSHCDGAARQYLIMANDGCLHELPAVAWDNLRATFSL
jgi:hypothetical protein